MMNRNKILQIFVLLVLAFMVLLSWQVFVRKTDVPSLVRSAIKRDATAHAAPSMNSRCFNKARLSDEWNNDELYIEDKEKFHLVTNCILYTHKAYYSNLLYAFKRPPTMSELVDRQNEVDACLQSNLNHPKVAAIHLLYYHPATIRHYSTLNLQNSHKLVLHLTKKDPTVGTNLKYIQKYLANKTVMILHQDNELGEGWDTYIDADMIRNERLMYALTRHIKINNSTANSYLSKTSCNRGVKYHGSHDVFFFYSDRLFPEAMIKALDISPSSIGMENLSMWYFRAIMNYTVINPCWKLKVYHHHQVPIREKGRKVHFDTKRYEWAPFTADLS